MKEKMTFTDLVDKIATETGETKKLVHDIITETVALNRDGLEKDGSNTLISFGRFSLKWHKSRKGRNPKSGESIDIPAHSTVNFKAITSLRDHINRRYAHLQPELLETQKEATVNRIKETKVKTPPPIIEAKEVSTVMQTKPPTLKEIPKIEKEEKVIEYHSNKKPTSKVDKTKRTIFRWWWLLILLILIVLIILFYLFKDSYNSSVIIENETTETSIIPQSEIVSSDKTIETINNPEQAKITVEAQAPIDETKIVNGTPASIYKLKPDDYFYSISLDYYKEASFWPIIYKANLDNISDPDKLLTGKEISLPALQGIVGNLSAKDKKNIAEGYLQVYLSLKNSDKNRALTFLWVANKMNKEILEIHSSDINIGDIKAIEGIKGEIKF